MIDYVGEDGLIVCGHKPVDAPIRSVRNARPVAVNVDTRCVAGGSLTAYLVEHDEFIAVESRQFRGRRTGGRAVSGPRPGRLNRSPQSPGFQRAATGISRPRPKVRGESLGMIVAW